LKNWQGTVEVGRNVFDKAVKGRRHRQGVRQGFEITFIQDHHFVNL
jgi:hypothetical protein